VSPRSRDQRAALVLVNPRASRLVARDQRDRILQAVSRAVVDRTGRAPTVEAGSLEAAREALAQAGNVPLIVVIGGDGTVREAAAALVGRDTPLAIVPAGTGNVLAAALGIRGLRSGLEAIRAGGLLRLDLGLARWWDVGSDTVPAATDPHQRIFTVACGMGLDARIMAAAEHEWKRRLQFGAYVGAAVRELARLAPSRFRIVADGEPIEIVGHLVLVANAGQLIPGRVGPRQPIDPTDGRLDLIVLGGSNVATALHGAATLMLRSGDLSGGVIRRSVREVTIESDPAQPIETDGDHHPPARLDVSVLPGAISVLIPEDDPAGPARPGGASLSR
jgi:diacylglycerol kinase family enzyme